MCTCSAALSIIFWSWRTFQFGLFLYTFIEQTELHRDSATFIMAAIYGLELCWALVIAGILYLCSRQAHLAFIRFVLKAVMMAWLIGGPIIYLKEEGLQIRMMQLYWLVETIGSGVLLMLGVIGECVESQQREEEKVEKGRMEECEMRASKIIG